MTDTAALPLAAWFLFRLIDFDFDSDSDSSSSSSSDRPLSFISPRRLSLSPQFTRTTRTSSTMPKNPGYTNYSTTEVKSFLDVLEEKLPIGPDQWQEVADIHEHKGYMHRDVYSL
mmetsp:Transcript_4212/g.9181  ORF Transcript_4212/g.9181 Transcript_4212/m.9181 type:complete len:115 (+) Transcript_4212:1167-1511(+)